MMRLAFLTLSILAVAGNCSANSRASLSLGPGWRNALKPHGKPADATTLASNGESRYVIVIPDNPTSQDTKAA